MVVLDQFYPRYTHSSCHRAIYLVGFTPKSFQVMGDSGIRYTISHERLAPEEREYLTRQ